MTTRAPEKGESTATDASDTRTGKAGEQPHRGGRPAEAGEQPRHGSRPASRASSPGAGGTAVRRRPGTRTLNARRAAQLAAAAVVELAGREPENVVSVAKDEDGWTIGIEVVELHRIPDTADILAVYQVRLDARGELQSCSREHRYHRASTEEG